jgi:hypothetical protein
VLNTTVTICAKLSEPLSDIRSDSLVGFVWLKNDYVSDYRT